MVCGGADCVCRAHFAGWFFWGAASWLVGASSFRHSIPVVWGGLGDGIDIEPTESRLLLLGWNLFVSSVFVSSVVSVGFVMKGQQVLL